MYSCKRFRRRRARSRPSNRSHVRPRWSPLRYSCSFRNTDGVTSSGNEADAAGLLSTQLSLSVQLDLELLTGPNGRFAGKHEIGPRFVRTEEKGIDGNRHSAAENGAQGLAGLIRGANARGLWGQSLFFCFSRLPKSAMIIGGPCLGVGSAEVLEFRAGSPWGIASRGSNDPGVLILQETRFDEGGGGRTTGPSSTMPFLFLSSRQAGRLSVMTRKRTSNQARSGS